MDPWYYVKIYFLSLLSIAVHEAGHIIAGLLAGYPWKGVVIGPLKVSREDGPVRFSYSSMWFSGFAMSFHNPRDTRTRQAIRIAAGPAASLAFAVTTGLPLLRQAQAAVDLDRSMTFLFIMNVCLFVGSSFPYTRKANEREKSSLSMKEFKNDAARLVELWREREKWADYYAHREEHNARAAANRAEYVRYRALTELSRAAKAEKRPRDWDNATVMRAVSIRDGKENEIIAVHYAFYWAEDRDDEASGAFIARALELRRLHPETGQVKVLLDAAYHAGFRRGDAAAARQLLTEAESFPAPDDAEEAAMCRSMTLRAEAAALLAGGRAIEAHTTATAGLASLRDVKNSNDLADRCLLERLVAACDAPNVRHGLEPAEALC